MYLWQRQAMPQWLAANELQLKTIAAEALVIITRPDRKRSLLQVACDTNKQSSRLTRQFGGTASRLPGDWEKKWLTQDSGPPIRVGKRLAIISSAPGAINPRELVIPASGAFGTGQHATTAMCLRLLEERTRHFSPGWRLLDVGTGSGILALAARRFGASEVVAIDHDPRALADARRNARRNQIRFVRFVRRNFLQWHPDGKYDVITANLFSEILVATLPIFCRALKHKGCLILSGILRGQIKPVLRSLGQCGFYTEKQRARGKWVALLCSRRDTGRRPASEGGPRSRTKTQLNR
jgi:ribosomal protein L11 methyltransferase